MHIPVFKADTSVYVPHIFPIKTPLLYFFLKKTPKRYKDGVPIKEDSRVKCVRVDDETFELRFDPSAADDSGNWAVIARNPHGEMSQFFSLSAQMLPRFEKKLEDVEANEGKQVR